LPWAYYTLMNPFQPSPVMAPSAPAHDDVECYDCHKAHASKDNVWVQFYPTPAQADQLACGGFKLKRLLLTSPRKAGRGENSRRRDKRPERCD
jgi:hypothetical protein